MKVHVVDKPDPEHLRAQLLGDTEQWRKWLYRKLRLEDKRHLSSCQWSSLIDLFDCHFAAVAVMDDDFWDTDLISFDIKLVVERAYGKRMRTLYPALGRTWRDWPVALPVPLWIPPEHSTL